MDVGVFDGIETCHPVKGEWTLHAAPQCSFSGRYTLLEQLGASPGRRTILARDEIDGGYVVVKVVDLLVSEAHRLSLDALRERAALLTSVCHPHVARLLDWFEFLDEAGGHKFAFVWEFVEGESVRQACARGKTFSDGELVSVARDVLSALSHLHAQSPPILHGRISSGNIVVATVGGTCSNLGSRRTAACLVDLDPILDASEDIPLEPFSAFLQHHAWLGFPGWDALRRLGYRAQQRTELVLMAGVFMLMRTGEPPLLRFSAGWPWRLGGGYLNIEEMRLQEGVKPDFGLVTFLFRMGRMTRGVGHVFPLDSTESYWGSSRIAGCNPRMVIKMNRRCMGGLSSADEALRCLWKLEAGGGRLDGGSWNSFDLPRERHPLLRSSPEVPPAQTVGWVDKREMRCCPGWRYIIVALYYLAVCHMVFIPAVMLEIDGWWKCFLVLFGFLPLWLVASLVADQIVRWKGSSCRKLVFMCGSLIWWGTETLCQIPLMLLTLLFGEWPLDRFTFLLLAFFWVIVLAMVDVGLAVAVGKEGFVSIGDWILADAVWYKTGRRNRGSSLLVGQFAAKTGGELYL